MNAISPRKAGDPGMVTFDYRFGASPIFFDKRSDRIVRLIVEDEHARIRNLHEFELRVFRAQTI